jgi:hypothetical protein
MVSLRSCRIRSITFRTFSSVIPVDKIPERSSSSVDVRPSSHKFVSGLNCFHQKACFSIWYISAAVFLSLKQTIYTRAALPGQPSQKANSRRSNNGNMFTNDKLNHPARRRLPPRFKTFAWGSISRYFDVLLTILVQNSNFWNFWIEPRIFAILSVSISEIQRTVSDTHRVPSEDDKTI